MRNVSGLETVFIDYAPKDVQFFYVYKSLAHPEINSFVQPITLEERLMHVAEFNRRSNTAIPWLCDNMDNALTATMGGPTGGAPNGEYILDPEGKLIRKRFWSNPNTLRADLEELVGAVENPTKVEDIDVTFAVEQRPIASGVVEPLKLPAELFPIKTEAIIEDETPYYVKLRAEASRSVLAGNGNGQMYLGVYLDPIYKVHWNNEAGRVNVIIKTPEGVTLSETELQSPEVEEPADVDPRQFLVSVEAADRTEPLEVTVNYFACDDALTFCIPVSQKYKLTLEPVRAAGSRPGVFMPEMFANVAELDADGDGKITKVEVQNRHPGQTSLFFGHLDYNFDDVIDMDEIQNFFRMMNNGRGFTSAANDGEGG